jgi:hypothetical protein
MDNMEYVNSALTKKRQRQEKRELKQIGNQQKRTREKVALQALIEGDLDFIPDFLIDKPTVYMNGLDRTDPIGQPKVDHVQHTESTPERLSDELDPSLEQPRNNLGEKDALH